MDTVHHRHATSHYAFLAAITELVMMEMERDAWSTPFDPAAPPSLTPRCLLRTCHVLAAVLANAL